MLYMFSRADDNANKILRSISLIGILTDGVSDELHLYNHRIYPFNDNLVEHFIVCTYQATGNQYLVSRNTFNLRFSCFSVIVNSLLTGPDYFYSILLNCDIPVLAIF